MTRSDWLDRFVKGVKGLFIDTWTSWCKLIMIIPAVKFILYDSLACKRAYNDGYLLSRKRETYFAGKTFNLPLTYLRIKPFKAAGHLGFLWWTRDLINEPEAWWRSSRRAGHDDVLDCPGRWTDGDKFLVGFVARVGEQLERRRAGHVGLWLRA